ncbi:MAG: 2-C-methyl-D-erythritol 2,4-cyclodiphosphate synthase [Bacteroidetes bacterium]|nr:MAG: 2-C-methyl-D-erythritol 2,4-cyclodiphosphate synthase [Bacteroidota bacterium]
MIRYRNGIGYDVHKLVKGRDLILGGVKIDSEYGLSGHSDADVLAHAISDALLGAASLGDIGTHFPDTDLKWKDADSLFLLSEIGRMLRENGYTIANVDSTVVIESPRLRPHIESMRIKLSESLGIPVESVSVKATTSELMGFAGRREGVIAMATCSIFSNAGEGAGAGDGVDAGERIEAMGSPRG